MEACDLEFTAFAPRVSLPLSIFKESSSLAEVLQHCLSHLKVGLGIFIPVFVLIGVIVH
jgi:hypothetical protein